jgi:hypothetical protein
MRLRSTLAAAAILSLVVLVASASGAASRADFVAKVDPICKRSQKQAAGILKGADNNFKLGKAYARIARKGRAALADIYHIGAAPSDLVIFDRWVQKIQRENAIVRRMARSLKHGQTKKADILMQEATDANKRGEKVVRDFGFTYCDESTIGTP